MPDDYLSIYTIYRHPQDFPSKFVVREFKIVNGKTIAIDPPFATESTLERARAVLPPGLSKIMRSPNDDFSVVESWL